MKAILLHEDGSRDTLELHNLTAELLTQLDEILPAIKTLEVSDLLTEMAIRVAEDDTTYSAGEFNNLTWPVRQLLLQVNEHILQAEVRTMLELRDARATPALPG